VIRVVLDTNIIVSAFFWGGIPRSILNAARLKKITLVTTEILIEELKDVLSRPKFAERLAAIEETAETLLESGYRSLVEVVEPAEVEAVVKADPDDDALIACAIGGNADYIVSGDKQLLKIETYKTVKIWTVNQFWEEISAL
jgi:putative PIN family toxin of toxin-antitoxin system